MDDKEIQALPEVMTLDEASKLLRVHPQTVKALARAGRIPGKKIGRAWRFSKKALLDYLRAVC